MSFIKKKDLDLDDVTSNAKVVTEEEEIKKENQNDEQQEEREWKACVKRLENICKEWLGSCVIPVIDPTTGTLTLKIYDLKECSSEDFIAWINHVYPPAKDMDHTPDSYKSPLVRTKTILAIKDHFQRLKFPVVETTMKSAVR
jgi:hypothetical protein